MCFRDNYTDLKALGAEVLGVSVDDHKTQCEFAAKNQLCFPLLADESNQISRSYQARRALLPFAKRVTFIIDPTGHIAARFHHEFQVSRHLDDVVRFLRAAQSQLLKT